MNTLKKTALACLLAGLAAYIAWRLSGLHLVMTHIDDIGPLVYLLENRDLSWFKRLYGLRVWTYSPFPFLFTAIVSATSFPPAGLLWWNRFAAFAAWLLGLGLFWALLGSLRRDGEDRWPFALALLLFGFALLSRRGIIESSQGYNYAWCLPAAAVLLWAFLSRRGRAWFFEEERIPRAVLRHFAFGWVVGFTYQAFFIALPVFMAEVHGLLREKKWAQAAKTCLSGAAFSAPFLFFFRFHFSYFAHQRGHPPWAPFLDSNWGLLQKLVFMGRAWLEAVANVVTVLPWGTPSMVLAALVIALALAGTVKLLRSGGMTPAAARILRFTFWVAVVWTVGAWTRRFSVGPTRHTFILQVPVLLWLGLGLWALRVKGAALSVALAGVIAVSVALTPAWVRSMRNQVDLPRIEGLLEEYPSSAVLEPVLAFTSDQLLLLASRPELKGRVMRGDLANQVKPGGRFRHLIIVSHRGPPGEDSLSQLREAGFRMKTLVEKAPLNSTELCGNINGGNGFYLYLAERGKK